MIVNQVSKKVKMSKGDIVKYQLLTHCYLERITVSNADLDCLTMLAFNGEIELTEFCNYASDEGIFKTPQSVRNAVIKNGKGRKMIRLATFLNVQAKGNVLLDYKFVSLESEEV
jgi:hypothetical protein